MHTNFLLVSYYWLYIIFGHVQRFQNFNLDFAVVYSQSQSFEMTSFVKNIISILILIKVKNILHWMHIFDFELFIFGN